MLLDLLRRDPRTIAISAATDGAPSDQVVRSVVAISLATLDGMSWRHTGATSVEKQPGQQARLLRCRSRPPSGSVRCEADLDPIPDDRFDNPGVIARIGLPLMLDPSDIERIAQDGVEMARVEGKRAARLPVHDDAGLGPQPKPIGLRLHLGHGAQPVIEAEDRTNGLGFLFVGDE